MAMADTPTADPRPLRDRVAFWFALLVVPAVCAVSGNWLIFNLFGDGRFLPEGSTGSAVLGWWDDVGGRQITAGCLSLLIMLAARRRLLVSLAVGAASAALAFAFWVLVVLIWVVLDPEALS